MKTRCRNPKGDSARWYIERGVEIHPEWEKSFEAFFRDMGKRPSPKHSLDRWPNKEGNYEPGNCRWATITQQIRNRRDNIVLTIDGTARLLVEWSDLTGVKYHTIRTRLKAGWSERDAVFTPANGRSKATRGRQSNNKSGFKGVSWRADRGTWLAVIGVNRKLIKLGTFHTADAAARAYDAAALKHFGEFAVLNFPINK